MSTPTEITAPFTEVASGLQFPEGPVAMPDGSVVLVEMFAERVSRIAPDGTSSVVAEVPGGPNGLAVGPDGSLFVCNNGAAFTPVVRNGAMLPGPFDPARYRGGSIQRIDGDGAVATLYTECDGRPLRAPNDLVMDGFGGFYFTDHGTVDNRGARTADVTGIYYATCDGSAIREVAFPTTSPNGIGLSPDGTVLYYAETPTGRVFQRQITEPGVVARTAALHPSTLLAGLPGLQYLDSLAVDGDGWVCVATLLNGGITSISSDGSTVEFLATDDSITTNICFGGPDLSTAYITLSSSGRLVSAPWPRRGLRLAHQ